jgi:DNA polymerase
MRWSAHQQVLLRELGVPLWLPPQRAAPLAEAEVVTQPAPSQRPVERARPAVAAPMSPLRPGMAPARPTSPVPDESVRSPLPAAAGNSRVATLDWPELREAVRTCQACRLCESRTQTVFGVGNSRAQWMLIGEAPGEQEDRLGEPFVGKAGQLLDQMLRAVGLTREEALPERQVYIANVLKCRPPGNRNPEPQEVAKCEPFLQRQVELVQPRLILAMGRFAVQSLLQSSEPIGRLRGRVHQYHGVPVVVTYHPAYLLRNPLDKSRAWEDLCLAREVLAASSAQAQV